MRIEPIASRARALPLFLVVMSGSACTDAVSDPMAALMAEETRAALDLRGTLPVLGDLWVESGGALDADPVTRWEASWELPTQEGRALRSLVYDDAVPDLFGRLGQGELEKLLVEMDSTLARVDRLSAIGIPERVSRRLDSTREMLTTAWVRAEEGEDVASLVRPFRPPTTSSK